jgi:hypothetical protein
LIDCIQIIKKHQKDDEIVLKIFEDGDTMLWLPKDPKIKEGKKINSVDWPISSIKGFK